MVVAVGPALLDLRLRFAVQAVEHPPDHALVYCAQHVRVALRGGAERAVLGDEREATASRFGVRREAVRRERVGDGRHRGLGRSVSLARFHARGERAAVLVSDLLGEGGRLVAREALDGAGEKRAEQVVAPRREGEVRVEGSGAVDLGRPPRGLVP